MVQEYPCLMNLWWIEPLIKVQGAAQEGAANLKPWSSMNQDFRNLKSPAKSQREVLEMWYFIGDIFCMVRYNVEKEWKSLF